jgi:hypothetical protein
MKAVTIHDDGTTEEYEIEDELFTLTPRALRAPESESFGHAAAVAAARMVHGPQRTSRALPLRRDQHLRRSAHRLGRATLLDLGPSEAACYVVID